MQLGLSAASISKVGWGNKIALNVAFSSIPEPRYIKAILLVSIQLALFTHPL